VTAVRRVGVKLSMAMRILASYYYLNGTWREQIHF